MLKKRPDSENFSIQLRDSSGFSPDSILKRDKDRIKMLRYHKKQKTGSLRFLNFIILF